MFKFLPNHPHGKQDLLSAHTIPTNIPKVYGLTVTYKNHCLYSYVCEGLQQSQHAPLNKVGPTFVCNIASSL